MAETTRSSPPGKASAQKSSPKSPQSPKDGQTGGSPPGARTTGSPSALMPAEHWTQNTEALEDAGESDLEDTESSTASITSSILKYREINGRTYHREQGDANYWGANDDKANEALDIFHHVQTLGIDGKLFLSPLRGDVKKAVDIGTGTGIWAMDFADQYPGCEVVGTELSPIQPDWVPPNLQFQIDDCTQAWTFEPESVDYVHIRFLGGSIRDWPELFRQAYRCLKPGGYLESVEPSPFIESDDGTVEPDSAMGQWGHFFVEGAKKLGMSFTIVQDNVQNTAMEEAGFADITEHKYKSPIGTWPREEKLKEIGTYMQASMSQDVEGAIQFMANVLNDWTLQELQVYGAHLRKELKSGKKHAWHWEKIVYGRKPESE